MAEKSAKSNKLKARLPRGLADRGPAEIAATRKMTEAIRAVYERYGFEPVETPAIEYTDALGKFLPDQDRPNEGVFSFQDDDEQWLSLRYDLTAPLARHVAENFQNIALPYRSYRFGWVFRNEKPGPGRFRQFMQFDADTVGAPTMAADAEICMMAADTMEALGVERGQYVVKVNNRKILDGVMESIGLHGEHNANKRLIVLRALDKYDRLGIDGVRELLGTGRKDPSGDFTKGAGLTEEQVAPLLRFVRFGEIYNAIQLGEFEEVDTNFPNPFFTPPASWDVDSYSDRERMAEKAAELSKVNPLQRSYEKSFNLDILGEVALLFEMNDTLAQGLFELAEIDAIIQACGYGDSATGNSSQIEKGFDGARILIDPSVVRGLEYYTGPVYEVELLLDTKDEKGRPVRFGSVGGGGRYDGLVSRFRGEPVPATGFSIGVSRLQAALTLIGKLDSKPAPGPVIVTVFGGDIAQYQKLVAMLRGAGIRAEMYLGNPKHNLGQQMKYADRRGSPCAIVQGSNEREKGEVQIKDLILGATLTAIKDRDEYLKKQTEVQFACREDEMVAKVRDLLARHNINWD